MNSPRKNGSTEKMDVENGKCNFVNGMKESVSYCSLYNI